MAITVASGGVQPDLGSLENGDSVLSAYTAQAATLANWETSASGESIVSVVAEAFVNGVNAGIIAEEQGGIALMFNSGETGAWYDPFDTSTLFQDAAGTISVTADGDPVGYMGDKSGNGNHCIQSDADKRPIYRTDGTLHWLEFDGVNDFLTVAAPSFKIDKMTTMFAGEIVTSGRFCSFASLTFIDFASTEAILIAGTSDASTRSIAMFVNNNSATIDTGEGSPLAVYEAIADEPDITVRRDGANTVTTSSISVDETNTGDFYLGCGFDGSNVGIHGDLRLYSFVTLGRVATSTELSDTRSIMAGKAGVTL